MAANTALPSSSQERILAGKARRTSLPRQSLAQLGSSARDPLGIIEEQNRTRLQELVPLRAERMSQSPFAFYRGTAALMAADLADEPHTGILVPSCGDAHVANFGFYASPQRTLVFDLNDFDESAWAPWEWDLKRLLTSVVIAGLATERAESVVHDAVISGARAYATALRHAAGRSPQRRYFTRFDADAGADDMDEQSAKVLQRAIKQARKRTGEKATRKLTSADERGVLHFVENPPIMQPVDPELRGVLTSLIREYLQTASPDIALLMQHFAPVSVIRRVVGVGSVGTRCALALFQDGDGNTQIIQAKQAAPSVLEQYGRITQPDALTALTARRGHGGRVVAMQRVLQAVSDPFLGSLRFEIPDAGELDFYVRQFHDMKGGIEVESIGDSAFTTYARACAVTLARAHAQSPKAAEISGYVGGGRKVGEALWHWGRAYAERSRADYDAFTSRR